MFVAILFVIITVSVLVSASASIVIASKVMELVDDRKE